MTDLLVIVPTRGRPDSVRRLLEAWWRTSAGYSVPLFCFDADDETRTDALTDDIDTAGGLWLYGPRRRLAGWTNFVALGLGGRRYKYLASFGDDHVPRTHGWDKLICDALAEMGTGFVYPDDGHEHENLPTAVAVTADIVQTLGWMCFPGTEHLYVDMAWRDIGRAIGRYRYLPDVLVEHLSTYNGKAEEDDTSRDHWSEEAHERDRTAWNVFCATGGVTAAAEKLKPLL